MVTLRALPTHTSAVGVSASAKPARVVAGVDMHTLYVKNTHPASPNASSPGVQWL